MFSLMNIGITLLIIIGFIIGGVGIYNLMDDGVPLDKPEDILEWFRFICSWLLLLSITILGILILLGVVYYGITQPIHCESINNDSEECKDVWININKE